MKRNALTHLIQWLGIATLGLTGACASDTRGSADPKDACLDGGSRCSGDVRQNCSQGEWVDSEDCATAGQVCDPKLAACVGGTDDSSDDDPTDDPDDNSDSTCDLFPWQLRAQREVVIH